MVLPAIIGAAGSLLGGAISNRANRSAQRRSEDLQKEFAQHGIRWRVADAKAAGLHPLYALGAQVPSFSPAIIPDSMGPAIAEAGQNIGRAVGATATSAEKAQQALSLKLLEKQLEETDARIGVLQSEEARNRQEAFGTMSFPMADYTPNFGEFGPASGAVGGAVMTSAQASLPARQGLVEFTAPKQMSTQPGNTGVGASENPMLYKYTLPGGQPVLLPGGASGDPAEALESLTESPLLMWATYMENKRAFGEHWAHEMFRRYVPGFESYHRAMATLPLSMSLKDRRVVKGNWKSRRRTPEGRGRDGGGGR